MWNCYTSILTRTRINGFMLKKEKKLRQEASVEKSIRKYFLRERIVKCGKWLAEDGEG